VFISLNKTVQVHIHINST